MPYPKKKRTTKYVRKGNKGVRQSLKTAIKKEILKATETKHQLVTHTADTSFGTTLTSPANWYSLNNINKGTESNERVGNQVTSSFLDVRGSLLAKGNLQQYHKVMVISMNKQSDPLTDLLENNTGSYSAATTRLEAIYARINTAKYRVLATRVMKTGTSNGGNSEQLTQMFHMKIPLKGVMEFQEDESVCQKRRIAIIAFSRDADNTVGSVAVEWTFNSKLYYKDL